MTATLDTIDTLESLPVKIDYVGQTKRDHNWDCDQWRVTLSSKAGFHSFDYFTGLGLRSKPKTSWVTPTPKKPKVADVLHSLIMDASAADENFHDWCANYGYSDDSIKAMNTYKACLEIAVALRKHFSPDTLRQVRELLQDY
jgi:hypothetical protein